MFQLSSVSWCSCKSHLLKFSCESYLRKWLLQETFWCVIGLSCIARHNICLLECGSVGISRLSVHTQYSFECSKNCNLIHWSNPSIRVAVSESTFSVLIVWIFCIEDHWLTPCYICILNLVSFCVFCWEVSLSYFSCSRAYERHYWSCISAMVCCRHCRVVSVMIVALVDWLQTTISFMHDWQRLGQLLWVDLAT